MSGMKLAVVAILIAATNAHADLAGPQPEIGRFRAHVATLASRSFAGRRGDGGVRAAYYVRDEFLRLGLEPAFGDSYFQKITGDDGRLLGRNVGARIVGSDPALRAEWVVVGAHFDHLGRQGGAYYPGADDNATGTAMMLEVARCLARNPERPKRSVLILGFDLEEDGLWGSRFLVDHPPIPLKQIKLFVTADMIGRDLGGVCENFVFAFGADTTPALRPWVKQASAPETIRLGLLGNDILVVDRSDYGPFRRMAIPYLFFSTGENPKYHQTDDTADTINYDKAIAATRIIFRILDRCAQGDLIGGWEPAREPHLDEAIAMRDVLKTVAENRGKLHVKPLTAVVLNRTLKTLDSVISRGKMTPSERSGLVRSAQYLMYSVF